MQTVPSSVQSLRYVIVSPVKDEERNIERTLRSVTSQTIKPALWVIVDDGSTDMTVKIVSRYVSANSFIRLVSNPDSGVRKTGSAVICAFNFGYQSLGNVEYDFIVKLDCDISFEPDYFEELLDRFANNKKLGIASGVYFEKDNTGKWKEVVMPHYHAAGACKVIRRECFDNITGFIVAAGWDTVDEIRAMTHGWKTCHFPELRMYHHKPEGSGIGRIRTSFMHGEIYYLTNGSKLFLCLKGIHRLGMRPYVINALAFAWGYISAGIRRKVLLVTEEEARYYKTLLRKRLSAHAKKLIRMN